MENMMNVKNMNKINSTCSLPASMNKIYPKGLNRHMDELEESIYITERAHSVDKCICSEIVINEKNIENGLLNNCSLKSELIGGSNRKIRIENNLKKKCRSEPVHIGNSALEMNPQPMIRELKTSNSSYNKENNLFKPALDNDSRLSPNIASIIADNEKEIIQQTILETSQDLETERNGVLEDKPPDNSKNVISEQESNTEIELNVIVLNTETDCS